MLTTEQYENYIKEVKEKFDVCCYKCKHFGRSVDTFREPSGVCQLNPPAEYHVLKVRVVAVGQTRESVTSPFPGVWPHDKCGKFEAKDKDQR